MKLLIVDADRDLVEMLTGWLKTLGHEVRRAYSGKQARIAWEDQKKELHTDFSTASHRLSVVSE